MNKLFAFIFLFLSTSIFSQIKTDWLELRDVHYKSQYSEEYDSYFQVPFFGKNIEALDNKEVTITGYMLTLAPDEGVYVCLLYTSPSPRDRQKSRMPSSA